MAIQIKNRREDLYINEVPPVIPDGIVTNTDYASASTAGALKVSASYGVTVASTGNLTAATRTAEQYNAAPATLLIGKGTLENVMAGLIQQYIKAIFLANVMEPDTTKSYAVTMEYNSVTQEWGLDFQAL